jgi:hypothetical protein
VPSGRKFTLGETGGTSRALPTKCATNGDKIAHFRNKRPWRLVSGGSKKPQNLKPPALNFGSAGFHLIV